tara:strand:+ start:181 stop:858 length:678 start_codon:yes stop_codon:yes gene_type:complete
MKVLELFKGSGSITEYYKNNNEVEVISLDFDKRYKPDILTDIMEWDYKQYPVGYFDIIWGSPECKIFSQLQYPLCVAKGKTQSDYKIKRKWDSVEHLREEQKKHSIYINKTIEIIEYFNPTYYYIENPMYSKIWDYVTNKKYLEKFILVDYCAFGYVYKKPTRILTNKDLKNERCKCVGDPKHEMRIGAVSKKFSKDRSTKQKPDNTTLKKRYSLPQPLMKYLLD